jgi:UDP-N-acetylmuramate--L-alanine ligase
MRTREEQSWFTTDARLPKSGTVHFVGIGGAGMSALARVLIARGYRVTGSDISRSATTEDLADRGARITIGHDARAVHGADLVVLSDAIPLEDNPEALEAQRLGLPRIRRSRLLGLVLEPYKVIAVTGTHGKSTVTAAIAQVLARAGESPLALVGADVEGFDGNVLHGEGPWAVVEACEAYEGYFDIDPYLVVLTNLEPDHLDRHGSFEALKDSVSSFIRKASGSPGLVFCADDPGASEVASQFDGAVGYGVLRGDHVVRLEAGELKYKDTAARPTLIGKHNSENLWGAVVASSVVLSREAEQLLPFVEDVRGCVRRLQPLGEHAGVLLYDDYAHHPTEIAASLLALKEAHPDRRLVCVFQPHLYSRTRDFLHDFAPALARADWVFITDIYPAREKPIPGISSLLIAQHLEELQANVSYVPSRFRLPREVAQAVQAGDLVVAMGAGNIDAFPRAFVEELERSKQPLRVAVFQGGLSAEREVSLLSGGMVADALRSLGYEVVVLDPEQLLWGGEGLRPLVAAERPDIVFLALHGTGAEDGRVQGLLDLLEIPYTGSGVAASALAMDKSAAKQALRAAGLRVPAGVCVPRGAEIPVEAPLPAVVKPNAQGSTVGLSFVQTREELESAVKIAWKYDNSALIEEWIEGVEVSVPVVGNEAFPAVEIVPFGGRYDFSAKYTPGATEEIVPARISESAEQRVREAALTAHRAIGADDISRSDFIITPEDDVVILEVNTLPGMTMTSLVPRSAASVGISYAQLCERILRSAMERYGIAK